MGQRFALVLGVLGLMLWGGVAFAISLGTPVLFTDPFTGESKTAWQLIYRRGTIEGSWMHSGFGTDLYTHTGVYHVTGGTHHSLMVVMDGYIVMVEAPLNDERSRRVIAAVRLRWPKKPIRYVVITHLHSDFLGGLRAYVAEGAKVIVAKENKRALESFFKDLQGKKPGSFLETVSGRRVLKHGVRSMEIYPVQNSHAKGMLMVYLPREKLLFESDLFIPGFSRQNPVWAKQLWSAIRRWGLKVDFVAAGRGRMGTLEELRQVVAQP